MESTIVNQEKSTHQCPTFHFDFSKVEKHPNADKLGLFKIPDSDYNYVLNLDDWKDYNGYVCWIVPDSLVDTTRPEFNFLITEAKYNEQSDSVKGGLYARVKAKKLRGIVSYGLMVKINTNEISEDESKTLGILHYEPPINGGNNVSMSGDDAEPPKGICLPKYDVDAYLKYGKKMFREGEPVMITEKIHGANSRFIFKDGTMYVGSRTLWKKEFSAPPKLTLDELKARIGDEAKAQEVYDKVVNNFKPKKNLWWIALENTPQLRKYCEQNPGYAVYGEVFGQVQKGFNYGAKSGEVLFRAFDILQPNGKWMDGEQFLTECRTHDIPHVPVLQESIAFDFEKVIEFSVGNTTIENANHIREGCVVKPTKERWDDRLGRVNLKIINPAYLEK